MNKGFTLIEVLVVISITGIISTFMILNFQRTRLDLNQTRNVLIEEIRAAQAKANASTQFYDSGNAQTKPTLAARCGYGIHYEGITTYSIYVGPRSSAFDCSTQNRNFGFGDVRVLPRKNITDPRVEFKASFQDIFFEPPGPITFINNSSASASINITIGKKGVDCPQDCKTINVSTSGKIE